MCWILLWKLFFYEGIDDIITPELEGRLDMEINHRILQCNSTLFWFAQKVMPLSSCNICKVFLFFMYQLLAEAGVDEPQELIDYSAGREDDRTLICSLFGLYLSEIHTSKVPK